MDNISDNNDIEAEIRTSLRARIPLYLFGVLLLVAVILSISSRMMQTQFIQYDNGTPTVSTLDAYKWTRLAEEYKSGVYNDGDIDKMMYYPDGMERTKPIPMLPFLMAKISTITGNNVYEAGFMLMPIFASLFMIPLALYFYRINLPIAGIMGGVLGTFAMVYYGRTYVNRIDTDALNLFFPFLIALLIKVGTAKKTRNQLFIYAVLIGIAQYMYCWWYEGQFLFIIANLCVLLVMLLINKVDIKTTAISCAIYLVATNPLNLHKALISVFDKFSSHIIQADTIGGGFPDVYATVSELGANTISTVVNQSFVHPIFFYIAAVGFIFFIYKDIKSAIPLGVPILLGLMPLINSVRFLMYMVPLLGVGLGVVINSAVNVKNERISYNIRLAIGYGAMALILFFFLTGPKPGFIFYTQPSVSREVVQIKSFKAMKEVLPADAAVFTWWDNGLIIEKEAGAATFHDGMSQRSPKTWLIAKGLISSPDVMYQNIAYISNNGMTEINSMLADNKTAAEIGSHISLYDEPLQNDNIFVTFTPDLLSIYGAISYIGGWDLVGGTSRGVVDSISQLMCTPTAEPVINCGNYTINTELGILNNTALNKIISVSALDGTILKERETGAESGHNLIILTDPQNNVQYTVHFMSDNVYNSSIVQMFFLGMYDSAKYERIIDNFPLNRTYKVLQ